VEKRLNSRGLLVCGHSVFEKWFTYCVCSHILYVLRIGKAVRNCHDEKEIRWQVVKATLDEFPTSRKSW